MISIVVPTYNEHDSVAPLVEQISNVLSGKDFEVVFVDDDSPDGTADEVDALSGKYPVKVIRRKDGERGLAPAVVEGLKHITGDIVLVMDGDLQHPPQAIPSLVKEIEHGVGVAVASRYIPGGKVPGLSLVRKLVSKGATLLAHLILPRVRSVNDPMSGFFAFSRSVVDGVELKPIGFKILLEILTLGKYESSAEVPIEFSPRDSGDSKLTLREQVNYLKHLVSLFRRNGEFFRFCKFCTVGFSGVIVNLGIMWLLTEKAGIYYVASAAISIEAAIISNFLLNNRFTFSDRKRGGGISLIKRLLRFNLVSLFGTGINLFVIWLLTSVFGIYYLLSNCVGIVLATSWNYLVNNWWTWKWRS